MKNEAIRSDASPGRFRRASARAFSRVLVEYGELRADPARGRLREDRGVPVGDELAGEQAQEMSQVLRRVTELLKEMQRRQLQLAIVVDEYGVFGLDPRQAEVARLVGGKVAVLAHQREPLLVCRDRELATWSEIAAHTLPAAEAM